MNTRGNKVKSAVGKYVGNAEHLVLLEKKKKRVKKEHSIENTQ